MVLKTISPGCGVRASLMLFFIPKFCSTVFLLLLQDSSEALKTHFQIADNLYVKGKVPPSDKVLLWLGVSTISTQKDSAYI